MKRQVVYIRFLRFYVTAERQANTALKRKPVVVADGNKMVDHSEELLELGIDEDFPVDALYSLVPNATILQYNFDRYRGLYTKVWDIVAKYSNLVEPVSLHEGFIDLTKCLPREAEIEKWIGGMQQDVLRKTQLESVIGGGSNKLIAQLASFNNVVLKPDQERAYLDSIKLDEISWIDGKMIERLNRLGIKTLKDLSLVPKGTIESEFGKKAISLKRLSLGIDPSPVLPLYPPPRYEERVDLDDLDGEPDVFAQLGRVCERVYDWVAQDQKEASEVLLSISSNGTSLRTNQRLSRPIQSKDQLFRTAQSLLLKLWEGQELSSIAVSLSGIRSKHGVQLNLWTDKKEPDSALEEAVRRVKDKYGSTSIKRAKDLAEEHPPRMAQLILEKDGKLLL